MTHESHILCHPLFYDSAHELYKNNFDTNFFFFFTDAASGSDSQCSHTGLIPYPKCSTAKHRGIPTATPTTTTAAAPSYPVRQPVGLQKHAPPVAPLPGRSQEFAEKAC